MTPEEYQRIKDAEKEHLRKLKQLKQLSRQMARQQKVSKALGDIVSGREDVLDTHDRAMEQLEHETALGDARLDLALEGARAASSDDPALDDDLRKARAKEMLRQMKLASGLPASDSQPDTPPQAAKTIGSNLRARKKAQIEEPETRPAKLPEKTIGRMKP